MSIDVCIKQKGLFKKTIPLDVIVGDELAFGINDGMRMVGDDQEGKMIFYNPNSIGRGFHISWDEDEKSELNLRLLNPTTTDEMRSFFNCLRRITSYWKCSVTIDGIEEDIDDYLSQEDDLLAFNHRVIKEVSEKIVNGETDSLATVYKGNIIKNLIMDCQSYTKYRPNETTGGIFVSWRRKEELPTGA